MVADVSNGHNHMVDFGMGASFIRKRPERAAAAVMCGSCKVDVS
jgi:hypothetical protein